MPERCLLPLILMAMSVAPQVASAYSLGGDWTFNMTGTLTTGGFTGDYGANQTTTITIGQSSTTQITLPLTLPDPVDLTINIPGTISGTSIYATTHLDQVGPFQISQPGFSGNVLFKNLNLQLDGTIDGINPLDTTGGFARERITLRGFRRPRHTSPPRHTCRFWGFGFLLPTPIL